MMNGDIEIQSASGEGSTFTFTLVCKGVADEAPLKPAKRTTKRIVRDELEASGAHVLVAEDHPVNRLLIKRMLEKLGYESTIVEHGMAAVQSALTGEYDMILMDCQMPVLDGYAATGEIRAQERNQERIPIVALTANAAAGDPERCIAAGMDDYLSKPIEMDALRSMIERWAHPKRSVLES